MVTWLVLLEAVLPLDPLELEQPAAAAAASANTAPMAHAFCRGRISLPSVPTILNSCLLLLFCLTDEDHGHPAGDCAA
jgi:hypothetical protein